MQMNKLDFPFVMKTQTALKLTLGKFQQDPDISIRNRGKVEMGEIMKVHLLMVILVFFITL